MSLSAWFTTTEPDLFHDPYLKKHAVLRLQRTNPD